MHVLLQISWKSRPRTACLEPGRRDIWLIQFNLSLQLMLGPLTSDLFILKSDAFILVPEYIIVENPSQIVQASVLTTF